MRLGRIGVYHYGFKKRILGYDNEHINKSDLEYLESNEVKRQRKELKKNWLGKDELYQFEIAQMQKQIQSLYIRIKELNEEIYELKKVKKS